MTAFATKSGRMSSRENSDKQGQNGGKEHYPIENRKRRHHGE